MYTIHGWKGGLFALFVIRLFAINCLTIIRVRFSPILCVISRELLSYRGQSLNTTQSRLPDEKFASNIFFLIEFVGTLEYLTKIKILKFLNFLHLLQATRVKLINKYAIKMIEFTVRYYYLLHYMIRCCKRSTGCKLFNN